jgi:hypothetical protein
MEAARIYPVLSQSFENGSSKEDKIWHSFIQKRRGTDAEQSIILCKFYDFVAPRKGFMPSAPIWTLGRTEWKSLRS